MVISPLIANIYGERVLPVNIDRTTSRPIVTPDVQKIAQMKLDNIIPSVGGLLGGRGGGAGGILGTLLGGDQPQQGHPAAKPTPNQQQQHLQDAI